MEKSKEYLVQLRTVWDQNESESYKVKKGRWFNKSGQKESEEVSMTCFAAP
jgi:hypothetical protein